MALGGFMSALGDAFIGYGKDRDRRTLDARNRRLDTEAEDLHDAQMENYRSQADMRRKRTEQEAQMRTPDFQDTYVRARGGDPTAQAKVVSIVSGHPNESTILAPFNERARRHWDTTRGGYFDEDTGTFTKMENAGESRQDEADKRATERLRMQEAAARRAAHTQSLSAARTALDEARRDIPRPSKVPEQTLGTLPTGKPGLIKNPAHDQAVSDSTTYERGIMDPARKNLNSVMSMFDFGDTEPAQPALKTIPPGEVEKARAEGRLPEFYEWAKQKGYRVP